MYRCANKALAPVLVMITLVAIVVGCRDATAPDVAIKTVWTTAATLDVAGRGSALSGIWGSSPSDIWVVASDGMLHHYDGTAWSSRPSGSSYLAAVWGRSATDVWAVGTGETILHYDGTTWSAVSDGATEAILQGVSGRSASDLWAVGPSQFARVGIVAHYDGTTWSRSYLTDGDQPLAVWDASPSDVWAVGFAVTSGVQTGWIMHNDGSSWTRVAPKLSAFLRGLWGTSGSFLWAIGEDGPQSSGAILFYDGANWSTQWRGGVGTGLYSVWGSSPTNVWTIGQSTVLHFDGRRWSAVPSPTTGTLRGVWTNSPGDVWMVDANHVFHGMLPSQ